MRTAIEQTCFSKLQFPYDLHGNDSKSFRCCQHDIPEQFSATYLASVKPAILQTTETEAEENVWKMLNPKEKATERSKITQ
jgi:hypothetical protein